MTTSSRRDLILNHGLRAIAQLKTFAQQNLAFFAPRTRKDSDFAGQFHKT
jgi:hypothetical protein